MDAADTAELALLRKQHAQAHSIVQETRQQQRVWTERIAAITRADTIARLSANRALNIGGDAHVALGVKPPSDGK
jgi:hypothetical protein